jgi:hypothetical protein
MQNGATKTHRMGSAGDQEKSCTASSFTDFLSSSPMSGASYTLIALRPSRAKNLRMAGVESAAEGEDAPVGRGG